MNLAEIDLNLLSAFDALWAERQVTRSARRLGISQPAMSDALRRLRVLFGDALFVRAGGAMQPTPRAVALARDLGPILQRVREVMGDQIAFAPQEVEKTFTIASTDYTSMVLLPGLISRLRVVAPGVDLRIVGYQKAAIGGMLERGETDMAIGVFADPPPSSVRTALFSERFVGIVRAGHPALTEGAMTAERFATLPQALVSLNADRRGVIDDRMQALGLQRRIALVVPYMLLLPSVLAASDLIATLPQRIALRLEGAGLQPFDLPFPTEDWSVDLLWSPTARTDRASAWLRGLIVETAKGL